MDCPRIPYDRRGEPLLAASAPREPPCLPPACEAHPVPGRASPPGKLLREAAPFLHCEPRPARPPCRLLCPRLRPIALLYQRRRHLRLGGEAERPATHDQRPTTTGGG